MKVMITGASGLLGHKLVEYCQKAGLEVIATDIVEDAPIRLDITDTSRVTDFVYSMRPHVIINAAAMTNVDLCEEEWVGSWRVNVDGATNVALACHLIGAHMIQLSTSYIFDGEKGVYKEEGEQPNPLNYYARTKLAAELMVSKTKDWCIARTDAIFGWGRPYRPNFAQSVIDSLERKQPIKVVTDQYSSPTLNENLAQMLIDIAKHHITGIVNTAGATRISGYYFARKICQEFGLDEEHILPVESKDSDWKARRPRDTSMDVSKAESLLAHEPMSIDEALRIMHVTRWRTWADESEL